MGPLLDSCILPENNMIPFPDDVTHSVQNHQKANVDNEHSVFRPNKPASCPATVAPTPNWPSIFIHSGPYPNCPSISTLHLQVEQNQAIGFPANIPLS